MTEEAKKAITTLYAWTVKLAECAGEDKKAADAFWNELVTVPELLKEYAYY